MVHGVRPSAFHDPTFAAAAARAAAAGVAFRALRASVSEAGTHLTHELAVDVHGARDERVVARVAEWCAANRLTTGWTRSASGQRVANRPFAHAQPVAQGRGGKARARRRSTALAEAEPRCERSHLAEADEVQGPPETTARGSKNKKAKQQQVVAKRRDVDVVDEEAQEGAEDATGEAAKPRRSRFFGE